MKKLIIAGVTAVCVAAATATCLYFTNHDLPWKDDSSDGTGLSTNFTKITGEVTSADTDKIEIRITNYNGNSDCGSYDDDSSEFAVGEIGKICEIQLKDQNDSSAKYKIGSSVSVEYADFDCKTINGKYVITPAEITKN